MPIENTRTSTSLTCRDLLHKHSTSSPVALSRFGEVCHFGVIRNECCAMQLEVVGVDLRQAAVMDDCQFEMVCQAKAIGPRVLMCIAMRGSLFNVTCAGRSGVTLF